MLSVHSSGISANLVMLLKNLVSHRKPSSPSDLHASTVMPPGLEALPSLVIRARKEKADAAGGVDKLLALESAEGG
ncbi:hypothetical protein ANCDUO_05331 [Ancylostoma duodenale]|uniref:Uncharacterized protein n=1 Tax=Ancylostoma duodenale TaxID=51022 RepID=A0A0C2H4T4_9BILA|nr:hypothetical protein ANCDUO_05331 [Ancylostoma duodenale]